MSANTRSRVLDHLSRTRALTIGEIAEALKLSSESVRRQIEALVEAGQVEQLGEAHGGDRTYAAASTRTIIAQPSLGPFEVSSDADNAEDGAAHDTKRDGVIQDGMRVRVTVSSVYEGTVTDDERGELSASTATESTSWVTARRRSSRSEKTND